MMLWTADYFSAKDNITCTKFHVCINSKQQQQIHTEADKDTEEPCMYMISYKSVYSKKDCLLNRLVVWL